jgi:hypothetical protein
MNPVFMLQSPKKYDFDSLGVLPLAKEFLELSRLQQKHPLTTAFEIKP